MSTRLLGASHSQAVPSPDGTAVVTDARDGSPHFTDIGIPRQSRECSKLQACLQDPVVTVCAELARMLPFSTSGPLARSPWQSRPSPSLQPSAQAHLPSSTYVKCLREGLPHPSPLPSLYSKRQFCDFEPSEGQLSSPLQ